MARSLKNRAFGRVIRERRHQLNLNQEEVAHRIRTSTPYVGHLETGKRHPSHKVVNRLADVLGIDRRDLFLLANPHTTPYFRQQPKQDTGGAWQKFRKDRLLQRAYNITAEEMEMLSRLTLLGEVQTPREYIYVLNAVRCALGR